MMTTSELIHEYPVFSAAECAEIREVIHRLRPHWVRRNLWAPFFTLGAASYLDAKRNHAEYDAFAEKYNPLLRENFADCYQRVAALLEEALGGPVVYTSRLALPGFHVYLSSKLFERPIASIHCDSQYQLHDWSGLDADLTRPISFTLSIALPKNGGGLNVWDISYAELLEKSSNDTGPLVRSRESSYHAYRIGSMVLHSGHLLHQAAPGKDVQPDDERITLQGHAIQISGIWNLYW